MTSTSTAWALTLLIVLAFCIEWLAEDLQFLPHQMTWAIEGFVALLALRAVWARSPRFSWTGIDLPVIALLCTGISAAVVQGGSMWTIVLGVRVFFRFIVLYYALRHLNLSDRAWRWSIRLVIALILLQIPIAMYQFAVLGKSDDAIYGSVRSSGAVVLLLAFAVPVISAGYIWRAVPARYVAVIPLLFVVPVLGEGKAFFLLALIPFVALIVPAWKENRRRFVKVAAVFFASYGAAIVSYGAVRGNVPLIPILARPLEVIRFVTDPPAVEQAEAPSSSAVGAVPRSRNPTSDSTTNVSIAASAWPRLQAMQHALRSIAAAPGTALFGFGIGSRTFTREQVDEAGSQVLYVAPLARRLFETGMVGVALHWALLGAVAIAGLGATRSTHAFWRAVGSAFPGLVMLYAVAEVYTETSMDAPALTFWLMAAAVARYSVVSRIEADDVANRG